MASQKQDYDVLEKPLSQRRQAKMLEEGNGAVDVVVRIRMEEVINHDLKGALDLMSHRAVGHPLLMELDYRVVGVEENGTTLHVNVTGLIPDDMSVPA